LNAAPPRYQLDAFDMQILKVLSEDARLSNRKIALALGVTEGTIRGRLKRLQEENYLRFTAVTGPSYLGNPLMVFIGVTAEQARVREVAERVAEMPGIRTAMSRPRSRSSSLNTIPALPRSPGPSFRSTRTTRIEGGLGDLSRSNSCIMHLMGSLQRLGCLPPERSNA
jgi:DNA-binding Lrp family transcriptional regulator